MKVIHTINGIRYTSPAEAAKQLGVCSRTILRLIKEKKLGCLKISQRKFFIPIEEINAITNNQ